MTQMLGARIASMRRSMGMSQADLAKALGISASAVGMYEQGRRQPSMELMADMAKLFGVSIDFLVTGKTKDGPDEAVLMKTLMDRVAATDKRLESRPNRPFSRQELAVLFAVMLMDS